MKISVKKIVSGLVILSTLATAFLAVTPIAASNPSSMTLQSKNVANAATFDVTLNVATTVQIAGAQAYITFDPAKLACNSATYFSAPKLFTSGEYDVAGVIDNVTGKVNGLVSLTGSSATVTGSGTWVTLSFTAKAAANNSVATISLSSSPISAVADTGANWLPTDLVSGNITIGTPPQADLTVSSVLATGATGAMDTYNISFNVNNIGTLDAGATSASVVIDGGAPVVIAVPAIAAGAHASVSTASPITLTGSNDSFTVTADSANVIIESNEGNNSANGSYTFVAASGKTTDVNGDIVGTLTFTQPTAIDFGHLNLGVNNVANSMNVLSNQSWTVNVHGNAPTTGGSVDGKMTKWNGSYDATTKLHNMLHVIATNGYLTAPVETGVTAPANYNVGLSGTDQLLSNGITEGQNADGTSGETRVVSFNQTVIGSHAALASGYSYHIVVSFTAATTAY